MKRVTKRNGRLMVVMAVAMGMGALPLQAQRGGIARGMGAGPNMGSSLDILLENREEVGLTGDQLGELEALKATLDSNVTPLIEEIRALRDQIRAGETDGNEGYRQLQALRGELLVASAPLQGRIQEILTVEQHRALQLQMRANRPGLGMGGAAFQGRAGRARAFQGRAVGRGAGRFGGSRGGYMPRQGFNGQGRAPAFGFRQAAPRGNRTFRNAPGRGIGRGGWDAPVDESLLPPPM